MNLQNIGQNKLYDVIIVGGGPAGLTAAIYLARARYRVLVIEKDHFGGQITITSEVVNYPGIAKCSGTELTESMRKQAANFGAEFLLSEVESLSLEGAVKTVKTGRGELFCYGVLLASGARPRSVGFDGETEFKGRGVAYCATCDGEFFTGKDVFVVGGGFAAAEESVFLTKFARRVTILVQTGDFTCASATAEHAKCHEKITVLTNKTVESVSGKNGLDYIRYKDTQTGETTEFRAKTGETFGVFVFAGYTPETSLVKGIAELDEQGYIITDRSQKTSVEGLYAAGDVCIKPLRQVVTAVGDGALAATELEKYAAALQCQTGIVPVKTQAVAVETKAGSTESVLFDSGTLTQLHAVFGKMQSPLILRLYLDGGSVSEELRQYMQTLADLTDKLTVEIARETTEHMPCVKLCHPDGSDTGLAFHGVPGGHEFTSFVLGLYNAAGPGQSIDSETEQAIRRMTAPINMKVLVSLSCTMCPELVTSAQKIAATNKRVTAEVYDLNHFPDLRDKYKVMSVPCLIINDEDVSFGKKSITQLMDLLKNVHQEG